MCAVNVALGAFLMSAVPSITPKKATQMIQSAVQIPMTSIPPFPSQPTDECHQRQADSQSATKKEQQQN
jgi:hypothetical protein